MSICTRFNMSLTDWAHKLSRNVNFASIVLISRSGAFEVLGQSSTMTDSQEADMSPDTVENEQILILRFSGELPFPWRRELWRKSVSVPKGSRTEIKCKVRQTKWSRRICMYYVQITTLGPVNLGSLMTLWCVFFLVLDGIQILLLRQSALRCTKNS